MKIETKTKIAIKLSNTQKRDLAYRHTIAKDGELEGFIKDDLRDSEMDEDGSKEAARMLLRTAAATRTIINPVVSLALRVSPKRLGHYQNDAKKRKEALMAELLQLLAAETEQRAKAAAATRKKKAGGIV